MTRLVTICVLGILLSFQGCQNGKQRPQGVLDEEAFVEALVKMHVADATLGIKGIRNTSGTPNATRYYNSLFSELNISRADFDSTMNYYSQQPLILDRVYDKVIARLTIMETEADRVKEEWEKRKDLASSIDSTKNFWIGKQIWLIPEKDGDSCKISFSKDTLLDIPSKLILEARYKISKDDEISSYQSVLNVIFDKKDTVSVQDSLRKDGQWHFTRLEVKIPQDKKVTRIFGEIFHFDDQEVFRKVEAEQIRLFQKPEVLTEKSLRLDLQKFREPKKGLKEMEILKKEDIKKLEEKSKIK